MGEEASVISILPSWINRMSQRPSQQDQSAFIDGNWTSLFCLSSRTQLHLNEAHSVTMTWMTDILHKYYPPSCPIWMYTGHTYKNVVVG